MENNDRKILTCIIVIIGIVFILCILILVSIWKPKNNIKQDSTISSFNDKLGQYNEIDYTEKEQVSQYVNVVINAIESSDTNLLYSIFNDEYKKYYNIDLNKAKNILTTKGFLGKTIISDQYSSCNIGNKKIYVASLKSTKDSSISTNVTIIEYSPKNFSIAFDDFIYYDNTVSEYFRDGIKAEIYDKVGFVSSYKAKVKLTNLSDSEIILNNSHSYEDFYLKFSSGGERLTTTSFLSGDVLNLVKNQQISFDVSYEIAPLSHPSISSYLLKDVTFTTKGENKDIEFTKD